MSEDEKPREEFLNEQLDEAQLEGIEALGMPKDTQQLFDLVSEYELNLSLFVEDRPHLAPSSAKYSISKKRVWQFHPQHNKWLAVPFTMSVEACRLFEAAFFEHGLQNMYVKCLMELLKKVMTLDKDDDTPEKLQENFLYNTAVLVNAQAVTRVLAGGYVMRMREKEFSEGMDSIIKL